MYNGCTRVDVDNDMSAFQRRRAARVIVASISVTGHTLPMLALARGLVAAGRSVTFLGGSRFGDRARTTGAAFVALPGAADFDDRRTAELLPEMAALPAGPPQMDVMFRWFADMAADQFAALQDLLSSDPESVVLHDMAFLGMWPVLLGAPGVRARTVAVGMLPFMFSGEEVTLMGPPPAIEGLDVRGAAAVVNAEIERALAPADEYVRKRLAELGAVDRIRSFTEAVYTLPDAFAQLTVPEFEFERFDLPASVHLVGPLPPEPTPGWQPPRWWPELTGRTVVVVTQGTMANDDLNQLVQPTLTALAHTDHLVVAALGRRPRPGELQVPDNARIEDHVPFDRLFPFADAVVTNGGYGGTQLALAHGIPVVVAGGSEDKPMTAARVAARGVGIDLQTATPAPDVISAALARVLHDPSYRENAARMARRYRTSDPLTAILDLIDRPGECPSSRDADSRTD